MGPGQGHSLRKDQVPPLSFPSYSPSATKAASRKAVPHECFSAFNPACYLRLCCQALHRAVPRKPSVQKPQDQSPHNCLHTCLLPPMMQAAHCRDSRVPGHHKGQWPGTTSMISQSLPRLALPSHLSFLSVFQSLLYVRSHQPDSTCCTRAAQRITNPTPEHPPLRLKNI